MSAWPCFPFLDAVDDVTGSAPRTPKSEYKPYGRYAIIDQGQELVAGYTDDAQRLYAGQLPVIVFGDHTRYFKYVPFPFGVGAEGVKILRPRPGWDPRFLYHYLSSLNIPSVGYSRHFKFLRRFSTPCPSLTIQQQIAQVLDRADALRERRRQALGHLGQLGRSIFLDMFGSTMPSLKEWPTQSLGTVISAPLRNGVSPSGRGHISAMVLTLSSITGSEFSPRAVKTGMFLSEPPAHQRVNGSDFLICRGNGNLSLVGRGLFPTESMHDTVFPDTVIAAPISTEKVRPVFLEHVWSSPSVRSQIESLARTTNGTYKVNQSMLEGITFCCPDTALQDEFSNKVDLARRLGEVQRAQLAELDGLFASLRDRAFAGLL
jgi:type I restriction enzyme S subunit